MARILTSDTTDLSPHELPATRSGKPEKDAREDVLGDGSIKKQLLYAGTKSKRKPQKGDYCRIHYNCELPNGREIDSSRDRGLPHPFTLFDDARVIEGWSHAVATMRGLRRRLTRPRATPSPQAKGRGVALPHRGRARARPPSRRVAPALFFNLSLRRRTGPRASRPRTRA